jgi:hypothetical protein
MRRTGENAVRGAGLDGVTTSVRYDLVAQPGAAAETLAVVGRDAWAVAGPKYVIVGSPLVADATNLPVRAAFVPWLGGVLTERLVGEPGQVVYAAPGAQLPRPRWADAMLNADGQRVPLDEVLDVPLRAGTYFLSLGDHRVGALVVNAPAEESSLERYSAKDLADHLGARRPVVAPDPSAWVTMAFHAAARRSLIEPALIIALIMLVVEAVAIRSRSRQVA